MDDIRECSNQLTGWRFTICCGTCRTLEWTRRDAQKRCREQEQREQRWLNKKRTQRPALDDGCPDALLADMGGLRLNAP